MNMHRIARFTSVIMGLSLMLAGLLGTQAAKSQDQAPQAVYIIYDSSNSMWGELPDGSRKYEAARTALRTLVDRDFGGRDLALRMYGHSQADSCTDSALVVPFGQPEAIKGSIIDAMEAVRPTGRTPIDRSLRAALKDFGDRSGSIILISDGIESCDADPCALVREWRDKDISISVHVVGLGLQGKDRAAMECIADAAGTDYHDAFSADDIVAGVAAAVEQSATPPDFALVVTTPDGSEQIGAGTLIPLDGGAEIAVKTNNRFTPAPGPYRLTAGVTTLDDAIYQPVEQEIEIASSGRTIGQIEAPRPPSVTAEFAMAGETISTSHVSVWRDGAQVGGFLNGGPAFISEGEFIFRTTLADSTQEVELTESFAAGDAKILHFDAVTEVHLLVKVIAESTGEQLKGYQTIDLLTDGAVAHSLNNASGRLVTPGRYVVHMDDRLSFFETDIEVTNEADQVVEYQVPTAALIVSYQTAAGEPEDPKRVFIRRASGRSKVIRSSNEAFALTPGTYVVIGWPAKGGYPETEIEVSAGEELTLTLKATN